jgi:RNA polymerase sigma factor (sigma-70 family)
MDDQEIVEGLRCRDTAAQKLFWDRYWATVYPICVRIVGKGPDATDLSVDLLTDFMDRRAHDIAKPGAMGAYLKLTAVRRSLDFQKKRRHIKCLDYEIEDSPSTTPEERAMLTTLRPRLDECLPRLTEKAQQTLRLKYKEEWTNERIGQLVGGSKQYIGRLIQQSLALLKTCIETKTERDAALGEE